MVATQLPPSAAINHLAELVRTLTPAKIDFSDHRALENYLAERGAALGLGNYSSEKRAAFLLFEGATASRGQSLPGSGRPWYPLIAAKHLMGLGIDDLPSADSIVLGTNETLRALWRAADLETRLTPENRLAFLSLRQVIAARASGLGNNRTNFKVGAKRTGQVAQALWDSVVGLLDNADADALREAFGAWATRVDQQQRQVRKMGDAMERAGDSPERPLDRAQLTARMWRAAYTDYRHTADFRRVTMHGMLDDSARAESRRNLNTGHQDRNVEHKSILKEIDEYFGPRSEPSVKWHNVVDRLRVFWFIVSESAYDLEGLIAFYATPEHTGLRPPELSNIDGLVQRMEQDIEDAMRAVRTAPAAGREN